MSDYTYQIESRPAELGGGWRLRLLEDGVEVGGGVFPADGSDPDAALAYDEALSEASAWMASRHEAAAQCHMMTHSGIEYVPGALRVRDVRLADIAHALSLICRFGGHIAAHYSVAQHSLLVARILEAMNAPAEAQLCGLSHDAHEAYVGDVPTPIKAVLGAAWSDLEHQAEEVVLKSFGLQRMMIDWHDIVAHADRVALATERRDVSRFDANINLPWAILHGVEAFAGPAVPYVATPSEWAEAFLGRFVALRGACGARSSIFTT